MSICDPGCLETFSLVVYETLLKMVYIKASFEDNPSDARKIISR